MITHPAPRTTPPTLADAGTPIYDQLLAEHPSLVDRTPWTAAAHTDEAATDTVVIPRLTAPNPWFTPRRPSGAVA